LPSFFPQDTTNLQAGLHWPAGLRAFRHRNFRLFFFGQLISLIGVWMQSTAQQWLVYRITGSQVKLGMITFIGFLPVLVMSLFMGVIVDKYSRRAIVVGTQTWFMLGAAALAIITFLGLVRYEHILLISFLMGIGNALDMPARQAFYIDLVERDDLMNAIALNSSVFNGARIIGPAIGGLVVAQLGEAPAFSINSITYLAVIGGLLMMHLPPSRPLDTVENSLQEFGSGVKYLLSNKRIMGLVIMIAALGITSFSYLTLLPVFAEDVLQIGVEGFGGLLSAQGLGALIGALVLAFWGDRIHKGRLLVRSRVLLIVAVIALSLSRHPALSMLALIFAGFALISQLTITNTLIQLIAPDELRGRVVSSYTWALGGFFPLGSLLIGSIGDQIEATNAVLVSAVSGLALIILGLFLFPETWHLE
jgi:MFS family permease